MLSGLVIYSGSFCAAEISCGARSGSIRWHSGCVILQSVGAFNVLIFMLYGVSRDALLISQ